MNEHHAVALFNKLNTKLFAIVDNFFGLLWQSNDAIKHKYMCCIFFYFLSQVQTDTSKIAFKLFVVTCTFLEKPKAFCETPASGPLKKAEKPFYNCAIKKKECLNKVFNIW